MNIIQKRVRLSLTKGMSKIYEYYVSQEETLGKILTKYLDLQYSYKYLIQQKKIGKRPTDLQIDDGFLSIESLNFDYEKKQRLLNTLSQELEQEYKFLTSWIQKNTNKDKIREENNLPFEYISNSETLNNEPQNNYEDDDFEDEDEQDCRAVRKGEEPDPNNPGYSKDGFLLW